MTPGNARRAGVAGAGLLSSLFAWLAARRATRKAPALTAYASDGTSFTVRADAIAAASLGYDSGCQDWRLSVHMVGGTEREFSVDQLDGERFLAAWRDAR